jgi:hypothetical protein
MKEYTEAIQLLLGDARVDPTIGKNKPIWWACQHGHVKVIKLLLSDPRVNPSDKHNRAIIDAIRHEQTEVVKLLLEDKRVIVSKAVIGVALDRANIEILRLFLAIDRIVIKNERLRIVDVHNSSVRVDILFEAALPRIWPRVIGNDIDCVSREKGHLRNKLDRLELKSSWLMLLCVKRRFTPRVAARVGDVLRDICSEWTCYQSREV